MTYRYTINAIPPSLNKFAGRKNAWEYREAKTVWKNIIAYSMHPKPGKPIEKCRMKISFFFPDKRKRDYDNYLKMLLDGIVAAGIIADDNCGVIETLELCAYVDKKHPRVEIKIKTEADRIMNKCMVIGNLTKAPENKTTPNGVSVTTFTVAVSRRYDREKSDFFNVVAWRGLADNCARYLIKGQKVAVEGELQTRSYEGQDGIKRYVTEIIADNVEFLSKPNTAAKEEPEQDLFERETEEDIELLPF